MPKIRSHDKFRFMPILVWSRGYKPFLCSTQLSMKFIMLINVNFQQLITDSNCMQKDLTEIICILERGEKCHSCIFIRKRIYVTLVTKFPAKNIESTPLKNTASGRQTGNFSSGQERSFFRRKAECNQYE